MSKFEPAAVGLIEPTIALPRFLHRSQRCQMTTADAGRGPAAWTAEEQRWYADLVVQCRDPKQSRTAINVPMIVQQLAALPLDECLTMRGKAALQGRLEDLDEVLWSHDRHGRWFAKIKGQKVWLGRKLAALRYARQHGAVHIPSALKASHNCGNCGCIRWQHIRFQSKAEDVLDREHHQRHPGVLRPEVRALLQHEPQLLTPNRTARQPARYRSPATSFDLPRPQMSSIDLV